ncbi:MAG: hypothetical protein QXS81_01460 [Candidatus Micrarchaeaceae archaeon]
MAEQDQTEEYYAIANAGVAKEQRLEETIAFTAKLLYMPDESLPNGFESKKEAVRNTYEEVILFISMYRPPDQTPLIAELQKEIQNINDNLVDSYLLLETYNKLKLKILWFLGRGGLNFVRPRNPVAKWDQKLVERMQIPYDDEIKNIVSKKKVNSGASSQS